MGSVLGSLRLCLAVAVVAALGLAASAQANEDLWEPMSAGAAQQRSAAPADIRPERSRAYALDRAGMASELDTAPLTLSLPAPDGGFKRFAVQESEVMAPELARKHPEIKTYRGRGIDDPAATLRFDLSPLGFHASVRGPEGSWYVDPKSRLDQRVYVTYYGRDVIDDPHGTFVERDDEATEDFVASLAGGGPSTGPLLRTYRLALVSNPGYTAFFGGPENVTAAKVTLMNRVDQIYEDETSIRMLLIAETDELNLDTPEEMTGPNGPCGTAPCFTEAQSTSCSGSTLNANRIALGQLVGASKYDIGHIVLGNPGGGVAGLGVVGGNSKGRGCTGLTAPVGDFFAVDYVAHEMGHQFGGPHTFNGTQGSCSGGNRAGASSVEPGSGSSIMAYAGICRTDDLQPHSDPYWSQRSFENITGYVTSSRPAIDEVQTVSLRDFDADGDAFSLRFGSGVTAPIVRGTNYTLAGIEAAIEGLPNLPAGTTVTVTAYGGTGALTDAGFQVTFGGELAASDAGALSVADPVGSSGFVGETAQGGPIENQGFIVSLTGNAPPSPSAPEAFTIPYRTPFALTGSATDPDGDTVTYLWEQNDAGGATGTALQSNVKADGPLFRQFGVPLKQPPYDPTQYNSPGANVVTTDPTRVLPDMGQILAGKTNAETGTCLAGDVECFSEFLPTSTYAGPLHFRMTARDGRGGVASADTTVTLAVGTGPFLVTSPNTGVTVNGGQRLAVSWQVAGTDAAPIGARRVRISLSTDGGATFPHELKASTRNDGFAPVRLPRLGTSRARIKVEAVGNVFFDVSNADFAIRARG